jgi:hypothetical protein
MTLILCHIIRGFISDIAADNWREYFCESHAAYVYHRKAFKEFDPAGYAMIEQVRKVLGL